MSLDTRRGILPAQRYLGGVVGIILFGEGNFLSSKRRLGQFIVEFALVSALLVDNDDEDDQEHGDEMKFLTPILVDDRFR